MQSAPCDTLDTELSFSHVVELQDARSGLGLTFNHQIGTTMIAGGTASEVYLQSTGKAGRFNVMDKKGNVYPDMSNVRFIRTQSSSCEYWLQKDDGKIFGNYSTAVNPQGLMSLGFYSPVEAQYRYPLYPNAIIVKIVKGTGSKPLPLESPLLDIGKPPAASVHDRSYIMYGSIAAVVLLLVAIVGAYFFFRRQQRRRKKK